MPHRQTKVEVDAATGQTKVTVPTQSSKSEPTATNLAITPGTSDLEALVEDAPCPPAPASEDIGPERRRQQTPVHVQVQQPNAGGLTGWPGIIANMSAVGAVIVYLFWQSSNMESREREIMRQLQEDRRLDRSDSQAQTAAMVSAIANLTTSVGASNSSNLQIAAEFRAARNEDRRDRQEMLNLLRAIAKKPGPGEEIEPDMSRAPMPRAKGAVAGSS